ncbi:hypothetical protein MMC28_001188 [Mycoblastus sanguinarius]|nr:hypothetical protein [Mycoblastus sanguinarius]
MKTDQSLRAVLQQLRSSAITPLPAVSYSRAFAHLAPPKRTFQLRSFKSLPLRPISQYGYRLRFAQKRYGSNLTSASPSVVATSSTSRADAQKPPEKPPAYELTFTCKPCGHRSTHTVSKQGYHKGTVLITCPDCKNRHVISDHLKIFADQSFTIEDLMRQKGELVKRGTLGSEGDLEFWEDGSQTERTKVGERR